MGKISTREHAAIVSAGLASLFLFFSFVLSWSVPNIGSSWIAANPDRSGAPTAYIVAMLQLLAIVAAALAATGRARLAMRVGGGAYMTGVLCLLVASAVTYIANRPEMPQPKVARPGVSHRDWDLPIGPGHVAAFLAVALFAVALLMAHRRRDMPR